MGSHIELCGECLDTWDRDVKSSLGVVSGLLKALISKMDFLCLGFLYMDSWVPSGTRAPPRTFGQVPPLGFTGRFCPPSTAACGELQLENTGVRVWGRRKSCPLKQNSDWGSEGLRGVEREREC